MRLVHLTDPHLTTPPGWRTLAGRSHCGKRYLGYASWARRRRHSLRRTWLDELIREVEACSPDRLLITGDLTQIGTAEEIAQARAWLESLGDPERVSFVPGNHDTYADESWGTLTREWRPWLPGDVSAFPTVQRHADVVVIGLSSCIPTWPFSACGLVGDAQLERLEAVLEAEQGRFRVLLLHHPPLPGMISFRKRLKDAAGLARVLERRPVDLILHGHRHRNQTSDRGGTKVYCTAPASAENASFRVLDVSRTDHGFAAEASLIGRGPSGFEVRDKDAWSVSAPG